MEINVQELIDSLNESANSWRLQSARDTYAHGYNSGRADSCEEAVERIKEFFHI